MPGASDYARNAEDAFNRRDLAALASLWALDFQYEGPGGDRSSTREEAMDRERALWEAFPDIRADLARHFTVGERLVIEGVMHGTHGGALRIGGVELAPGGRRIEIAFVALFSFADGVVARERVLYDRLELLQQLGVLPRGEES